jgi:hypothetical protein
MHDDNVKAEVIDLCQWQWGLQRHAHTKDRISKVSALVSNGKGQ